MTSVAPAAPAVSPAANAPNASTSPGPARPSSPVGLVLLGALLGAVATAALGFGVLHTAPSVASAPKPFVTEGDTVRLNKSSVPLAFETRTVELGSPLPRQPATGRVQTIDASTALSFAPLDGRVVKVLVRIGDRVKEGDKLVLVQSQDLASLQRELRAAELSIKTRRALVERLRLLVESRAASANDLLVAESELSEATLTATSAGSRLRSLSVRQEGETGYWITATKAGIVVQLEAVPGKQVGPGKEHPVATVANLEEVMVVGDVSKRDAATLSAGMEVTITEPGAAEQAPLPGKIETVSDLLDLERQTVPVRIRVKNDKLELRPNEFVEAVFAPRASDRLVTVPTEAVVSDGATSVVFVETEPNVLQRRAVKVGRQNRERTEILSGLASGDKIVVRGALLLLNAIDVRGLTARHHANVVLAAARHRARGAVPFSQSHEACRVRKNCRGVSALPPGRPGRDGVARGLGCVGLFGSDDRGVPRSDGHAGPDHRQEPGAARRRDGTTGVVAHRARGERHPRSRPRAQHQLVRALVPHAHVPRRRRSVLRAGADHRATSSGRAPRRREAGARLALDAHW